MPNTKVNMSGLHQPKKTSETSESGLISHPQHTAHGNKCYNTLMDFISVVLSVTEISLVIYLSVSHFSHSRGVIAVAMLAPILLNFVGVTYFLSDSKERKEFERVGVSRFAKDLFQAPVLGPVFTAIKVLSISSGLSAQGSDYARFEASAIKMRQAESFFGAAPEALVQLTVLLVTTEKELTLDNHLEIVVVILSVITLSEANMYAPLSNYYRLFHKYRDGDWQMPSLKIWQKSILFFHAFFSIGSRIAAMASLKAAVKYYVLVPNEMVTKTSSSASRPGTAPGPPELDSNALGYYLAMFFLIEIFFRMILYYFVRLIKFSFIGNGIPSGCYESISYGWRATILDLGYQSKNIVVQILFYTENSICYIVWWCSVINSKRAEIILVKEHILSPLTAIFVMFTLVSIFLLFAITGLGLHTLRGPLNKKTGK